MLRNEDEERLRRIILAFLGNSKESDNYYKEYHQVKRGIERLPDDEVRRITEQVERDLSKVNDLILNNTKKGNLLT